MVIQVRFAAWGDSMIGLGVKPNCVRRCRGISTTVCSLLILGTFFPGSSFAQDIAGRLIGRVQDSSGAVVVGAKVTAHSDDTGIDTTVTSGADGSYAFGSLHVGSYRVRVESAGFRSFESATSPIVAAKTVTVDIISPGRRAGALRISAYGHAGGHGDPNDSGLAQ